jgi:hypothetical protein
LTPHDQSAERTLRADVVGVVVKCTVCGRMKTPIGRSAPLSTSMCDYDCPAYRQEPRSGSLWPGESEADFGYPVSNVGTSAEASR